MPIENMTQIETSLGLAEGTLQEAIASADATKIEIPTGKFIDTEKHVIKTTEDQEVFIKNIRDEANNAGREMLIKETRNNLGYEFDGKTMDNLLKAHADKILKDAGTEPDAKIQEQAVDITKLQGVNADLQETINGLNLASTQKDSKLKNESDILSSIEGELILPKMDIMTLFLTRYEVGMEDGKQVLKQGGAVLKNDLREPLTIQDIMPKFLEPYIKPVEGGAGGGDSTGGGKEGTLEAFVKEMETAGKPQGSEEFNLEMSKRVTDKTLSI